MDASNDMVDNTDDAPDVATCDNPQCIAEKARLHKIIKQKVDEVRQLNLQIIIQNQRHTADVERLQKNISDLHDRIEAIRTPGGRHHTRVGYSFYGI